jgi:hypothetical protein
MMLRPVNRLYRVPHPLLFTPARTLSAGTRKRKRRFGTKKEKRLEGIPAVWPVFEDVVQPDPPQSALNLSTRLFAQDFVRVDRAVDVGGIREQPIFVPEVAMVGRSNVGKSTLINKLMGADLARTAKNPGCTRFLDLYASPLCSEFMLVDMPGWCARAFGRSHLSLTYADFNCMRVGYGYARRSKEIRYVPLLHACRITILTVFLS